MKRQRHLRYVLLTFLAFLLARSPLLGQEAPNLDRPGNWPAPPFWSPGAPREKILADAKTSKGLAPEETATASAPLPFVAITPCRQYDSRSSIPLLNGAPRTVAAAGAPCGIPATAAGISGNITVFSITGATGNGVFKVGTASPPTTAWINYPPTETQRANAGILATDGAGNIVVQVNQGGGSVNFTLDVNGYYSGGVVTDLTAGTGLTGGGTGSVTVGIAPGGVTSNELANNAVTSSKISANAVTAGAIASGQVVKSLNGATDAVTISGSGTAMVSTVGNAITVSAPGVVPSGSFILGKPNDTTLLAAGFTELGPDHDFWTATTTTGAPTGRYLHTAVWTGSRMIVWGGNDGSNNLNTGGQYDPAANNWTVTTMTGAPTARGQHTAVWTGSKMIVWGGFAGSLVNTGGQYDPLSDSWTATTTTLAPTPRRYNTAVWTGSKMIVWGGQDSGGYLNTGGQYDPLGDSWTATMTTGAPTGRRFHTAVWTGSPLNKVIIWGGDAGGSDVNTGGQYDPAGDSWTATMTTGAPIGRDSHTAVWTGSKMVVWGGYNAGYLNTGGQYDPAGNTWTATTTTGAPTGRYLHTALWTGTKMIVWGGYDGSALNTGGQYDPAGNFWLATTTAGAPTGRYYHTAVWTGSKMIVWGGLDGSSYFNTGGQWVLLSLYVKN